MIQRMIGASLLRTATYEQVEGDKSATTQALLVVVLVAVATGVATLGTKVNALGIVLGILVALVGWAVLAWLTYVIGATVLRTEETKADWAELARTLGFAQSPGILRLFGGIPIIGSWVFPVVAVWQLAAAVIAIRQALDYKSTWRAVGVAVLSFIPYWFLLALLTLLLAGQETPT